MNLIDLADVYAAAMGIEIPVPVFLFGDSLPEIKRITALDKNYTAPVVPDPVGKRTYLTAKQSEILCFIESFIVANGFAPSVRDIADAMGSNVNAQQQHLLALHRKGYINRKPHVSRSITIIRPVEAVA